ncbi:hypothetical protein EHQ46_05730 [Leptospira yanagawae]|uniref:Transposase n=1 Tax=Leptospira yanagawae TaxID=293069 RepID=A0ABY2M7J5_9LEPT|nr:hypothetical protein EHQ46_05730 [Leptospira yanagawae]
MVKVAESGIPIKELSRKYGINEQSFYRLANKLSGLELSDLKQIKELGRKIQN